MDTNQVITTKRLQLHTVLPDEYLLLQKDLAHPDLWHKRGFTDSIKFFASNPNPLEYRAPKIAANREWAKYLLRVAVLRDNPIIIASAGFHAAPDATGMVEIGFGVDKAYQNLGYGQEVLNSMWSWIIDDPQVKTLRYTVSPENKVSQHIIKKLGFKLVGEQIDEKDDFGKSSTKLSITESMFLISCFLLPGNKATMGFSSKLFSNVNFLGAPGFLFDKIMIGLPAGPLKAED